MYEHLKFVSKCWVVNLIVLTLKKCGRVEKRKGWSLKFNSSIFATLQNSKLVFQCSSVGPFGIGKGFLKSFFHFLHKFSCFVLSYNLSKLHLSDHFPFPCKSNFKVLKLNNLIGWTWRFWNSTIFLLGLVHIIHMHHGYIRLFIVDIIGGVDGPPTCEDVVPNISSSNIENLQENEVLQFVTIEMY